VTKSVKFRRDYVVATAFIAVSFLLGACSGNAAVGSANGPGSVPTSARPTTVFLAAMAVIGWMLVYFRGEHAV